VDEIQSLLEDSEKKNQACDVLLMPPGDADLSDEDSDEDEGILPKDPNHLGRGILSQISEIQVQDKEGNLPDLTVLNSAGEVVNTVDDDTAAEPKPGPSRTRGQKRQRQQEMQDKGEEEGDQEGNEEEGVEEGEVEEGEVEEGEAEEEPSQKKLKRTHNRDRIWKKVKPSIFGMSVPDFFSPDMKVLPDNCTTPYDYFNLFLDDEFVEQIMTVSKIYCVRKNRPEVQVKLTPDNYRVSVAIMFLTGYLTPSNKRMFWEQREDTENLFVRNAMSRNTFFEMMANTYFVETVDPDPKDTYWKVRPLFDHLNKTAKQWVTQSERLSVDEAIIKYFGPHPLKQFIRGKPHRFGYKVWVLATAEGELLACQPYAGAKACKSLTTG